MFKVNCRSTRIRCEICSKSTIRTIVQYNADKEHVAAFMMDKTKAAMFEKGTSTILDRNMVIYI